MFDTSTPPDSEPSEDPDEPDGGMCAEDQSCTAGDEPTDEEPDGGMCAEDQSCAPGEEPPDEEPPPPPTPAPDPDCDTQSDPDCEEEEKDDGYQDPDDDGAVVGCEGAECDLGGLGSIIDPADFDPLQTLIYTLDATGEVPLSVLQLAGSPYLTDGPSDVDFLEPTYAPQMTIEQILGIQPIDVLVNPGPDEEAQEGIED